MHDRVLNLKYCVTGDGTIVPVKPQRAYIIYFQKFYNQFALEIGSSNAAHVSKVSSERWKNMPPEGKEMWHKQFDESNEVY